MQSTPVCKLQGRTGAAGGGGRGGLRTEEEDTEEEDGSDEDKGRERDERPQPAKEDEEDGETRSLGVSSGGGALTVDVDKVKPSPGPWAVDRQDGLDIGSVGLVCDGQSSDGKQGSGVLQLLSTVCESGEESLVSREGGTDGGGVCGGEEEGGRTLVEEEEEEEEQGAVTAGQMCGLTTLLPSPTEDLTSREAPPQLSDMTVVWLPSTTGNPEAPAFCLVFLARRRRRLVAKDEEGEEAEEEVDVMELGFVFLDFKAAGLFKEDGGPARLLRFPILDRSLPRPVRDNGSEQGLRNGDLLSLSLQKTTAIEPPTTEPPGPPPVPPDPRRSMPSFPEPTEAPVVLLTPSRTSTDTLDWSFPFRPLPPSFLVLFERLGSFLLVLSGTLSFPTFLTRFTEERPDETEEGSEVTISEERHLFLVLLEDECDSAWLTFFTVRDFFFGWCLPGFVTVLDFGLGAGGSGGGGAGGVSSKDG